VQPPKSPSPYPRLGGASTSTQPPPTARMQAPIEDEGGSSKLGIVGYVIAAVVALAAGAWFAIHLSAGKNEEPAVAASPAGIIASPVPVASGPIVVLANALPVQVSGPGSTSSDRSSDVIRKAFDDNRGSLVDTYNSALTTDPRIADAMLIRLHIGADGTVETSAVRTSTSPNPALDAKVVSAMQMWKLPTPSAGDVDVDYPIIFARDSSDTARLESDLQAKVATLSPTEPPEYAAAPAPASSPEAAAVPSAGTAASPAVAAALPTPEAVPSAAAPPATVAKPRHKPRPKVAHAAPTPSLFEQVRDRLKANPKLRRVNTYTNGGTVTLFGKVFGESEKSLAEETVRNIPGVTSVVDNITTDESEWAQQQVQIAQQLANSGLDKVTVKVIGHDAFLDGQVKTELEKSRAVTVTEAAAPVTVRTNLIRVVPGSMFGF
jgi:TonB family protein